MTPPEVVLGNGDDASGLATMLAELLRDNMKDFRGRSRVASLARGEVVMKAADRDVAVTLAFRGREVIVTDGVAPHAPVISGQWLELAKLCSGQLSPLKAIAQKQLTITPSAHGVTALAGASYALSVPPSFYGDEKAVAKREQHVRISAAVTVGVVVLLVWRGRHRRKRSAAR